MRAHGPERAGGGVELVELPLEQKEEQWLEDFLISGTGRNLAHAADLILMRKVMTGKFRDVTEDVKSLNVSRRAFHDITWRNVVDGLDKGVGPRKVGGIYNSE